MGGGGVVFVDNQWMNYFTSDQGKPYFSPFTMTTQQQQKQ